MVAWETRERLRSIAARPFLIATPSLILGILIAPGFVADIPMWAVTLLFIAWLIVTGIALHRRHFLFSLVSLSLASLGLGCFSTQAGLKPFSQDSHISKFAASRVFVEGYVDQTPERGQRSTHLSLSIKSCRMAGEEARPCEGRILVFITGKGMPWKAGDDVSGWLRPRKLDRRPSPGSFDYDAYLKRRGYSATAFLRSPNSLAVLAGGDQSFAMRMEAIRGEFAAWLVEHTDERSASILAALSVGLRKGIDKDVRAAFQQTGTAHLLAISGLHLGVLSLWVYWIVWRLWARRSAWLHYMSAHQAAALLTLPATWIYAMLAGLHVATFRAAIMISIYLLGRLLWRRSDGVNSLFIAAFILLLITPNSLYDIGFQLSFLSVLAIVLAVPIIDSLLPDSMLNALKGKSLKARVLRNLLFIIEASLVCFVVTAPVIAQSFHSLSWIGPLTNPMIVPIFTIVIIPGLGLVLASWMMGIPYTETLLSIPVYGFDTAFGLQKIIVEAVGGAWTVPRLPGFAIALYYFGLFILLAGVGKRRFGQFSDAVSTSRKRLIRTVAFCLLLIATAWSVVSWRPSYSSPKSLEAWVPQMSDGNAVLLRFPDGGTELVFAGRIDEESGRDPIDRSLAPLLWSMGLGSIDRLWRTSGYENEKHAVESLAESFDIEKTVQRPWREDCRAGESWEVCEKLSDREKNILIWIMPDVGKKRFQAPIWLMEAISGDRRIIVAPYPHRIGAQAWSVFPQRDESLKTVLVTFGPGRQEGYMAMVERLQPEMVVLGMNRKLKRFLSNNVWEKMKSVDTDVRRTDRDGTIHIDFQRISRKMK